MCIGGKRTLPTGVISHIFATGSPQLVYNLQTNPVKPYLYRFDSLNRRIKRQQVCSGVCCRVSALVDQSPPAFALEQRSRQPVHVKFPKISICLTHHKKLASTSAEKL